MTKQKVQMAEMFTPPKGVRKTKVVLSHLMLNDKTGGWEFKILDWATGKEFNLYASDQTVFTQDQARWRRQFVRDVCVDLGREVIKCRMTDKEAYAAFKQEFKADIDRRKTRRK